MDSSFFNEDISENTPLLGGLSSHSGINPGNGLSMLNSSAVDVEGNPYGTDLHDNWSPDLWPDDA